MSRLGLVLGCLAAWAALADDASDYAAAEKPAEEAARAASKKGDYAAAAEGLEGLVAKWTPKFPEKDYLLKRARDAAAAYRQRQALAKISGTDAKSARQLLLHLLSPKQPETASWEDPRVSQALSALKRLDAKAGTFFDNRKIQVVITGDAIPASAVEQLTREITTVLGGLGFGSSDSAKSETLSIVLATGESIDLTKESFVLSPQVGYSCELKAEAQWGAAFRLSLGKRGVGLTTVAACLKARADEIPGLATFRIVEAWSKANP